jgi:hypothetical protein
LLEQCGPGQRCPRSHGPDRRRLERYRRRADGSREDSSQRICPGKLRRQQTRTRPRLATADAYAVPASHCARSPVCDPPDCDPYWHAMRRDLGFGRLRGPLAHAIPRPNASLQRCAGRGACPFAFATLKHRPPRAGYLEGRQFRGGNKGGGWRAQALAQRHGHGQRWQAGAEYATAAAIASALRQMCHALPAPSGAYPQRNRK